MVVAHPVHGAGEVGAGGRVGDGIHGVSPDMYVLLYNHE
jgi:hypothetical protein